MPARVLFCMVLGAWLQLIETSSGQTESAKQEVHATLTSREEKKSPLANEELKSAELQKKPSVVVRHLEKKQDGFMVAETPHFRILHEQGRPIVEKVGEAAELARAKVQRKWFGEEAADWDGKCSIYLHANREKYATKTGMKNTLGHMRTLDWGGIFLRSIHLPCKEPNLVIDVLPHEVSHSVMAIRFQGRTPRWADEGMAMLAETEASLQECLDRLPRYRRNEGLFATEVLLQTDEADHFNTMEYYAQSTSLVQFLTLQKNPQAFTDFLRTYITKGAATALKQHYGIQSFGELDNRWQTFAFGKKSK